MKKVSLNKLIKNNKALFLAYDQGLEHGPKDFNKSNLNPEFIINLAYRGGYTAFICQKGIAEKYKALIKKLKIPLILKLNGKTNLVNSEPVSKQICTVKEAISLGAKAVGYTIFIGSEHESEMMQEFSKIEEEAHEKGLPVIAWVYPRGKSIANKSPHELMEYAARVGLEIGADIVKLKYSGSKNSLKKAVALAGKTKIVIAGGEKETQKMFLNQAKEILEANVLGLAVGRNIWQAKEPLELTKKLKRIIFKE